MSFVGPPRLKGSKPSLHLEIFLEISILVLFIFSSTKTCGLVSQESLQSVEKKIIGEFLLQLMCVIGISHKRNHRRSDVK